MYMLSINNSLCKPRVPGLIPVFASPSDETLRCGHVSCMTSAVGRTLNSNTYIQTQIQFCQFQRDTHSLNSVSTSRLPDERRYFYINFLISQPKQILCVLKRPVPITGGIQHFWKGGSYV